jgi:hypothetical protein
MGCATVTQDLPPTPELLGPPYFSRVRAPLAGSGVVPQPSDYVDVAVSVPPGRWAVDTSRDLEAWQLQVAFQLHQQTTFTIREYDNEEPVRFYRLRVAP